jgi:hypothetical protein
MNQAVGRRWHVDEAAQERAQPGLARFWDAEGASPFVGVAIFVEDADGRVHQVVWVTPHVRMQRPFSGEARRIGLLLTEPGTPPDPLHVQPCIASCRAELVPEGALRVEADADGHLEVLVDGVARLKRLTPRAFHALPAQVVHASFADGQQLDRQLGGASRDALKSLEIRCAGQRAELGALRALPALSDLALHLDADAPELWPLENFERLTHLTMTGGNGPLPLSPPDWTKFHHLVHLDVARCPRLSMRDAQDVLSGLTSLSVHASQLALAKVGGLWSLKDLWLKGFDDARELSVIGGLMQLERLVLEGWRRLENLDALDHHPTLREFRVIGGLELRGLRALATLRQLTALELSGDVCDIGPIAHLGQLRTLSLHDCIALESVDPLSPRSMVGRIFGVLAGSRFGFRGGLPALTELSVRGSPRVTILDALGALPALESLRFLELGRIEHRHDHLEGGVVAPDHAQLLSRLGERPALRYLELGSQIFQFTGPLKPLSHMRALEVLKLAGFIWTDVSPLGGLENLRYLLLSGYADGAHLHGLGDLPRLMSLDLRGVRRASDFNFEALDEEAQAKHKHLRRLSTLGAGRGLAALGACRSLRYLNLVDNWVELDGLAYHPSLVAVRVEAGVPSFEALGTIRTLEGLEAAYPVHALETEALASLPSLVYLAVTGRLGPFSPLPALRHLVLHADELIDLNDITRCAELRTLTLRHVPQLRRLASIATLSRLRALRITEAEQLEDVAPLAQLSSLRDLVLDACPSLADLTPLAGLSGLTTLTVSGRSRVREVSSLERLIPGTDLRLGSRVDVDAGRPGRAVPRSA